jgi:hypothetical protein
LPTEGDELHLLYYPHGSDEDDLPMKVETRGKLSLVAQ